MNKPLKIAEGAFFVPSYPEQTVVISFCPTTNDIEDEEIQVLREIVLETQEPPQNNFVST